MSDVFASPGEMSPGTQFGGFVIEGVLGRGAMGIVYRARDSQLDRLVALKVVAAHLAVDEGFRSRFVAEARAAAMVEHAGIVTVYAAGEIEGTPYIAMRLVDGMDLAAYLDAHGQVRPQDALRILAPIAAGLDAASQAGIAHRDVKPSNIIVPSDGSGAVLVDFGVGRIQGSTRATQSGSWLGTADYVAPEQIRGADVDGRADEYSLGCVLYEMLSGHPPFRRDDTIQTLWAHVNETAPPLSGRVRDVNAELDAVLERAMAKAAEDRFPTAFGFIQTASEALRVAPPSETPALVSDLGPSGTVIGAAVPDLASESTGEAEQSGDARASASVGTPRIARGEQSSPAPEAASRPAGAAEATSSSQPPASAAGKPSRRSTKLVVAVLAAVGVCLIAAVVGISQFGGGGESANVVTTSSQEPTTSGGSASAVDLSQANASFKSAVKSIAAWRPEAQRVTTVVTSADKKCSASGVSDKSQCIKQGVDVGDIRRVANWFDGSRAAVNAAYQTGSSDPGFVSERSGCRKAALAAIGAGQTRAGQLNSLLQAIVGGRGDAAARLETLNSAYEGFDRKWVDFQEACAPYL